MSCANKKAATPVMNKKDLLKSALCLYAVTDRGFLGEETLKESVERAIRGGATFVQLREKQLDRACFLKEAMELKGLCEAYRIPFVINDNVDLAAEVDADGVHVGQSDIGADEARMKLGPDKIIGVSAQTVEQAVLAQTQGADYIGVGAVFSTGTKKDAKYVSSRTLKAICQAVEIPVIAIGGITRDNVEQLKGSGICGVAVVSAIFAQEDITEGTRRLRAAVEQALGEGKIEKNGGSVDEDGIDNRGK